MKEPGREWPGRPLICIRRNMPESRGKFKPSASDGQGSTKFAASHTARDFQAWPDIALAGNFSWRNRLFFIKKKTDVVTECPAIFSPCLWKAGSARNRESSDCRACTGSRISTLAGSAGAAPRIRAAQTGR